MIWDTMIQEDTLLVGDGTTAPSIHIIFSVWVLWKNNGNILFGHGTFLFQLVGKQRYTGTGTPVLLYRMSVPCTTLLISYTAAISEQVALKIVNKLKHYYHVAFRHWVSNSYNLLSYSQIHVYTTSSLHMQLIYSIISRHSFIIQLSSYQSIQCV